MSQLRILRVATMVSIWKSVIVASSVLAATASAIDDGSCTWSLWALGCTPKALCSYQFKFGDLTPGQSCRVREGAKKLPQQMHLAYAGATAGSAMTVSWATLDKVSDSTIWIGTSANSLTKRADVKIATESYYSEGDYSLYQYHASVTDLKPNTKYYYQVGSSGSSSQRSEVTSFTTARAAGDKSEFDMIVLGDLGFGDNGAATRDYVNQLANAASMVYHLGDISYADDDFLVPSQALGFYYEEVYNQWMNEMTPLMQQVPYMVLPGNHEAECHSPACLLSTFKKDHLGNYTAFNSRFKMPSAASKGVKSMWYSFDYASVHFTSLSSETDYPDAPSNSYTLTHKNGGFGNQVAWLEEDLKKAAANRANVPWIVVTMHRPIYHLEQVDSNGAPTDYSKNLQSAFEELFLKYNVDIVISGHRHRYERQMPIARNAAKTDGVSSDKKTYTNPKAPVYLVTGGAGNIEANELNNNKAAWHVVQSKDYGIMNVHVGPKSMQWTYINSDSKKVVDQFTIAKN